MAISKSNWNDDYLFKGNSSAEFIFNYGSQVTIIAGDGRILYRAARVMIHSSAAPKTILFGVARAMIHSGAMMAKTYSFTSLAKARILSSTTQATTC